MIFCVEDDKAICDLMIYALNSAGFEAEGFPDGEALFGAMKSVTPQLILLDIMLSGEDGITILKRLRNNTGTASLPIIMATAKGTEYDKVIGLDLGADDYLVKPYGMMEMISRVKAVLRRTEQKENKNQLQVGNLLLNTAEHIVTADEKQVQLTVKEFDLLKLFMENVGLVFTRKHLLQSIWGMNYMGETRTVDVHIGTLRTKLGSCGGYIKTVRGVGYRMEEEL